MAEVMKCGEGIVFYFTSGDRERDGLLLGLRFLGLVASPFAGWVETFGQQQYK